MYIKRFLIKNFGPIREIELFFEKNKAYHFIGENDSGKSMIIDAMKALCHNIADIHVQKYVSDYAESFYLEGEDFDGNIITLERGAGLAVYSLRRSDGTFEVWDRVRGSVPYEIEKIVNTYVDDTKDEKFNFRYADDKILFMNTTGGENYSFFQKAQRTDGVIKSLKRANKKEREIEGNLDIVLSKIDFEKAKLCEKPDINYIKKDIGVYKEEADRVYLKYRLLEQLLGLMDYEETLGKMGVPDEIKNLDRKDLKKKFEVVRLCQDVAEQERNEECLGVKIEKINVIKRIKEEYDGKRFLAEVVEYVVRLDKGIENMDCVLEKINEVKDGYKGGRGRVKEFMEARGRIERLNEAEKVLKSQEKMDEVLDKINDLVKIKEVLEKSLEVYTGVNKLRDSLKAYGQVKASSEEGAERLNYLDKMMTEFMVKNKVCPVVYKKVDKRCPFTDKTLDELVRGL